MSYEKVKQAKKLSVGVKQTLKAVEAEEVLEVIIARDADPHYVAEIISLSKENEIKITYVESMKKLGKSSGIEVGAATVGILK